MELKKKFEELYNLMSNSHEVENMLLFGSVMKQMMDVLIDNHPQVAQKFIEKLEAIKWYNYLTQDEAVEIVGDMKPSCPWSYSSWLNAMDVIKEPISKDPEYNEYALWATMCMIYSDSSKTIANLLDLDDNYSSNPQFIKAIYMLAKDKLTDEDGVFDIRKYFDIM